MKFIIRISFILLSLSHLNYCFDAGWTNQLNFLYDDRTHYEITECALFRVTYDLLKNIYGDKITVPSPVINNGRCKNAKDTIQRIFKSLGLDFNEHIKAVEKICESNRAVDKNEAFSAEAHFDNELFTDASTRILYLKYSSIISCKNNNYDSARESFGRMLHTVQDFYSHSNWVEFEPDKINENLGRSTILGTTLDRISRACFNCTSNNCRDNIVQELTNKKILTSGYFTLIGVGSLFETLTKPIGKCSHGGASDSSTKIDAIGAGINKDTLKSDHGSLHFKAIYLAERTSYDILKDFWSTIGNTEFQYFLGIRGSSLVIVMDTTGSMSNDIEGAKATAIELIKSNKVFNYVLSPFNDPTWGPITVTRDPEFFAQKINELTAYGGGDIPELYYHGLLDAVRVCEPNSIAFTFTDAPAKDEYLKPLALSLAISKNVRIVPILSSLASKSLQSNDLQTVTNVQSRAFVDDYNNIALMTGGFTIITNKANVKNISDVIIQQQNQENFQTLLISNIDNSNSFVSFFYVDKSIEILYFYLSSFQYNLVYVISPPNFESNLNYIWSFDTPKTKSFYLNNPPIGKWKIEIKSGYFNVKVTGISDIASVSSLNSNNQNLLHPGYSELYTSPSAGSNATISTYIENLEDQISEFTIDIVSDSATILQSLKPRISSDNAFLTDFVVPTNSFRIKTNYILKDNSIFERYEPNLYVPSNFEVNFNLDNEQTMTPGEIFKFSYSVINLGNTFLSLQINIQDSLQFTSLEVKETLNPKQTIKKEHSFKVPNNPSLIGNVNPITVSATDLSISTYPKINYATVYVTIKSPDVTFDKTPKCEIIYDNRITSCDKKGCATDKYWKARLNISESGSGLSAINTIKSSYYSNYTLDVKYDEFEYSSNKPVLVNIEADCCTQSFDVVASDIYGNVGRCKFEEQFKSHGTSIIRKFSTLNSIVLIIFIYLGFY